MSFGVTLKNIPTHKLGQRFPNWGLGVIKWGDSVRLRDSVESADFYAKETSSGRYKTLL